MSPVEFFSHPEWQRAALVMLHFLWQGMLIFAGYGLLVQLWGRRGAEVRYGIGVGGLALMAIVPLITYWVLDPPLNGLEQSDEEGAAREQVAESVPAIEITTIANANALMAGSGPYVESAVSGTEAGIDAAEGGMWRNWEWLRPRVLPWVAAAWMAGVALLAARLGGGLVGLWRIKQAAVLADEALMWRMRRLAGLLGLKRAPRLLVSPRAGQAFAVGCWRPMVVFPAAWICELSPAQMEAILAHELAHVRRYDLWVNLGQRALETVLFFHPAVWWISRRVREEREMCCDERAVGATGERLAYVTALELVARRCAGEPPFGLITGMGGRKMMLLERVRNVLGMQRLDAGGGWWPAGILAAALPAAIWLAAGGLPKSLRADDEPENKAAAVAEDREVREEADENDARREGAEEGEEKGLEMELTLALEGEREEGEREEGDREEAGIREVEGEREKEMANKQGGAAAAVKMALAFLRGEREEEHEEEADDREEEKADKERQRDKKREGAERREKDKDQDARDWRELVKSRQNAAETEMRRAQDMQKRLRAEMERMRAENAQFKEHMQQALDEAKKIGVTQRQHHEEMERAVGQMGGELRASLKQAEAEVEKAEAEGKLELAAQISAKADEVRKSLQTQAEQWENLKRHQDALSKKLAADTETAMQRLAKRLAADEERLADQKRAWAEKLKTKERLMDELRSTRTKKAEIDDGATGQRLEKRYTDIDAAPKNGAEMRESRGEGERGLERMIDQLRAEVQSLRREVRELRSRPPRDIGFRGGPVENLPRDSREQRARPMREGEPRGAASSGDPRPRRGERPRPEGGRGEGPRGERPRGEGPNDPQGPQPPQAGEPPGPKNPPNPPGPPLPPDGTGEDGGPKEDPEPIGDRGPEERGEGSEASGGEGVGR